MRKAWNDAGDRERAGPLAAAGAAPREIVAEAERRAGIAERAWALTERQAQVLAIVATGRTNKEIAKALRCAEPTVEVHMTALLAKAGCHGRAALIAKFWTESLVPAPG